jgi:hypothetical protein
MERRTAVIIGNGPSRADLDLRALYGWRARTFGCNRIYRDFLPDDLVAIDRAVIDDLQKDREALSETRIWVPELLVQRDPALFTPLPGIPQTWSGLAALDLAYWLGYDDLTLIGFDGGRESVEGKQAAYDEVAPEVVVRAVRWTDARIRRIRGSCPIRWQLSIIEEFDSLRAVNRWLSAGTEKE